MSYKLIKSSHFAKKAAKFLKMHPELILTFKQKLIDLSNDPLTPHLKTHRLKGQLSGSYSCSLTYEHRIIFKIFNNYNINGEIENVILLETIGTHDEVY